ncbi:MAG: rhodanese-like domain-containing protein [Rhodocyclaceae bacterium]|nr:rhodanese-like domain-containing protein [Zoogloeaceae bacterium]MCP5241403.1 rhodanese-like domain-containing protein [Zoogloeaceae bacterium]MCP5253015.1 rhodanese-like domain-containing protein [Zoogloeaceae bacterium]MCP5293280.1 rhodanese-like domain-containing protein [Zoogloeaceae bacterium]MCW5616096.1 rhodanese-like domain-containing protein [Rhodocyclaceae bacterium]
MSADVHTLDKPRQYCATLTLRKVTEEGAVLVDVRERSEIAALAFDVPAVMVMPMSEFERRFMELPRDQELILACSVGERSLRAAHLLLHHGYDKVANMEDGLTKWVRKGFPVRGDVSSPANDSACCAPPSPAGKRC